MKATEWLFLSSAPGMVPDLFLKGTYRAAMDLRLLSVVMATKTEQIHKVRVQGRVKNDCDCFLRGQN